jgi:protein gp37
MDPTEVRAAWRGTSGSGKDRSSSPSSCTPLTRDVFGWVAITQIAWCDATFNPWVGCLRVSTACDRCYAAALSWRYGKGRDLWDVSADRKRTSSAYWRGPLRWNERAQAAGTRRRVFCASMADVFDNKVPTSWRVDLWSLIRSTPALDWFLLTKRPQNIRDMLPTDWGEGWPHVWLGTTTENQEKPIAASRTLS